MSTLLRTWEDVRTSLLKYLVKEREGIKTELEKVGSKLDNSLEATERTFNFCHFALTHFNTGSIQTKREIFSTVSSNITLKDKKLTISKLSPYLIIENGILEQQRLKDSLVPKKDEATKGKRRTSVVSVPNWLAWQSAFRTYNWAKAIGDLETTTKEINLLLSLV